MSDSPNNQEDEIIKENQSIRRQICNTLIADGIPKNAEGIKLLMSVLDGMDRTAIGFKRASTESRIADVATLEADLITNLLGRSEEIFEAISKKPSQRQMVGQVIAYAPTPGEMGTDPEAVTYADIITASPDKQGVSGKGDEGGAEESCD